MLRLPRCRCRQLEIRSAACHWHDPFVNCEASSAVRACAGQITVASYEYGNRGRSILVGSCGTAPRLQALFLHSGRGSSQMGSGADLASNSRPKSLQNSPVILEATSTRFVPGNEIPMTIRKRSAQLRISRRELFESLGPPTIQGPAPTQTHPLLAQ